ncbi:MULTISPECIES: hypothetical protein [Vibrio]|uniref:hypothetical protein n=1 Tax=Vibrio TaxID=662 RepID=UPI0014287F63|nr:MULTISPECIES: hypothetical protein [Vibrio]MCF7456248.1 hypothetical protein [Vibrio sp. A1-1]QIS00332.1 hypothetical protein FR741_21640 [Vibrio diabolicus]
MAASNEWQEQHLTPKGWVTGNAKYDNGYKDSPTPEDVVLTVRKSMYLGSSHGKPHIDLEETFRSKDSVLVQELLDQFGEPTFGV